MAVRVVNGNDHTEDGWPLVDQAGCTWITVPGTNPPVSLQIQSGQPMIIMRAYAADHNAFVEPLEDADSASWTEGNSVLGTPGENNGSNHLGGTAMDLVWSRHRFQISYDGYNQAQIATVREILDFYEGTIFWGEDWGLQGIGPFDCMHFQMGGDTFNNPHTADFIARKIRADGFSTFRRDNVPVPPPPPPVLSRADGYALKIIAEGQRRGITPRGIQIALATGLVESNITIYANEAVPESMNIPHDAVGSDAFSVGIFQQQVRDTGNGWWWGDAATCMDPTSSAGLFYDRLAKLDYNGPNSPGSYAQAVQSSAFPDRYDQRFNDAVAIYNRLATGAPPAPPPLPGDDMALVPQEQWDAFYHAYMDDLPSLSPLRKLGEGNVGPLHKFVRWMDANTHVPVMKLLAGLGHPATLQDLRELAAADLSRYPDRADGKALAQAILADVTSKPQAVVQQAAQELQIPAPVQPQVVYVDRPAVVPEPVATAPVPVASTSDTGQVIGDLYRALDNLRLADALPIEARAPLQALVQILQTKNGTTL